MTFVCTSCEQPISRHEDYDVREIRNTTCRFHEECTSGYLAWAKSEGVYDY